MSVKLDFHFLNVNINGMSLYIYFNIKQNYIPTVDLISDIFSLKFNENG